MKVLGEGYAKFSSVFVRLALGTAFLSAVADRFGLRCAFGAPNGTLRSERSRPTPHV